MAKNYTIKEAVEIIVAGEDLESITDLGRRYPLLSVKIAALGAVAGDKLVDFMSYMPEYLTANKVNSIIKNGVQESTGSEDTEDGTEEPKEVPTAEEGEVMPDYSAMSGKVLWDILGKAGARKTAKSTKKPDLVTACEELWKKQHSGETEEEEATEEAAEETSENPYEGKSAMELFKECKKRGIKAAPKKPAKLYADLLVKDDEAKAAESTESEESDDWDEEEEQDEAPKKATKKAAAKPAKKAAKKEETSDDDGDDWDI